MQNQLLPAIFYFDVLNNSYLSEKRYGKEAVI